MSKYIRKTKDVYILMGNWGYGWDEILTENTWKDIRTRLKEYRENDNSAAYKIVKKRERIGA